MSEYNIQMNKYNALNAEYDQLYPKPMKHASTHAKDGDDPITPSSIGAAELGADGKVLTSQLPSMEVDAYTKVQTLSDTTKTLFGLDANAVPDDALALLSRFHKGLGNEYLWHKTKSSEEIIQSGSTKSYWVNASTEVQYSSEAYIDNGTIKLRNPVTTTFGALGASLVGKYFYANFDSYAIRFCTSINPGSSSIECYYKELSISEVTLNFGYVNSPDPNAYPPAVSDGYTYTPLGQLGAKVQIETGSYTGTGTYGASNKTSLTFDFQPSVIFIGATTNSNRYAEVGVIIAKVAGYKIKGGQYGIISSVTGNTVSFYAEADASNQFNTSEITYHYIAIG